ncbi:MAG: hypothetical protein ACE5FH_11770, partial [Candidatus Zixiibacteriota bacterium]
INLYYADRPYTSWSQPITVAADSANTPCDCVIDSSGNIHIVYIELSTAYLVTKKLTLSGGTWTVGSKVTIRTHVAAYPSVAIETGGKLWVAWIRVSGGFHYVHVKSSSDDGATWGSGSADDGDILTAGASSAFCRALIGSSDVHVIYTDAGIELSIKSLPLSGGSWSSEYQIATGVAFDEHFDAGIAGDGALGVAFDNGQLRYREYDGNNWGAIIVIDSNGADFPQLSFNESMPVVTYLSSLAADQIQLMYSMRDTAGFSAPAALDMRARQFDSVLLWEASTGGYVDATAAAASAATADIYHSSSSALVLGTGDTMYLGMNEKFRYVKFLLSTAGSGGTISFTYYDGSNFRGFTPAGGSFNLDSTNKDLVLWDDFDSVPVDWQKNVIDGTPRFWVKIEVTSTYSTGPVGSQITAIPDAQALIVRRQ